LARITRFRDKNRRARAGELRPSSSALLWFLIFAAVIGVYYLQTGRDGGLFTLPKIGDPEAYTTFAVCSSFRTDDCVIDGDTFRYEGQRIRIMDIDAPETRPPRCDFEADLGERATNRLRELLNEGPFLLKSTARDEDRYGRKLRVVTRDGRSLGGMLVAEGLAREWTGRRMPWCA
jgi:endonuclease YncB( thermonuclease family)